MEVSFSNNPAKPAIAVESLPPSTTAVNVPTTSLPAAATPTPTPVPSACPACVPKNQAVGKPDNFLLGDFLPSFADIILPRLSLAQNIGTLKESFLPGTVVLDRKVALFVPPALKDGQVVRQATSPVVITVVGFRPTRFVEKIVGSADRGQIVKTERDVTLAGGTLDYSEWKLKAASGMKLFQPLADAFIVIERPEALKDDTTDFTYEIEGKQYALALWACKGTAYTSMAKRVFFTSRRIGILREGGFPSWCFTVATREDTYPGGNKAWVPICLPKAKNTSAFLEFIANILNTPSAEATDADAEAAAAAAAE
jgi:hypothetical protein